MGKVKMRLEKCWSIFAGELGGERGRTAKQTSSECTFVLKLLKRTCSTLPRSMRWGSASSHVAGMATSGESFVYARRVKVPDVDEQISARFENRSKDETIKG